MAKGRYAGCCGAILLFATACEGSLEQETGVDRVRVDGRQVAREVQARVDAPRRPSQSRSARKGTALGPEAAKMRADYRRRVEATLTELDVRIAQLKAQSRTAQNKDETDALLAAIQLKRAGLRLDLDELDHTAQAQWDAARAELDKQWDDLEKLVPGKS